MRPVDGRHEHQDQMALETASYISQLNPANPAGSDRLQQGDDQIRLVKSVLKTTFPNIAGAVTPTHDELNSLLAFKVPVGAIMLYSGAVIPKGWAECNGQTVAKSDGTGTIATPNLSGRVPVGVSSGHALGDAFGQTSRTFTSAPGGSHSHSGSAQAAGTHSHSGATQGHALTEAENGQHSHYEFADVYGSYNSLLGAKEGAPNRGGGGSSSGSSYDIGGSGTAATLGRTSTSGSGTPHTHPISDDGSHTHGLSVDAVGDHTHAVTIDTTQPSLSVYFIMKV